mgnify:CR=1 FL=1|jgi:hypothetical protein
MKVKHIDKHLNVTEIDISLTKPQLRREQKHGKLQNIYTEAQYQRALYHHRFLNHLKDLVNGKKYKYVPVHINNSVL